MLRFLTAGESHGEMLIAILDGFPSGVKLSAEKINKELARRQKGVGSGARMKIENDKAKIVSGVLEGKTIGSPITFLIYNKDHSKWRGKEIPAFSVPRPGHADLTATVKYGYNDLRPALERASARETAARVAVGAVCKKLLSEFGIHVQGYVVSIGKMVAEFDEMSYEERFEIAEQSNVRCPDKKASVRMEEMIKDIMKEGDTLGGQIEVVALGVPPGLGSHVQWDRKLDGKIGKAVLSIPAIKGVEIGDAVENSKKTGTQVQDAIYLDHGEVKRKSNRAGGIEGGISNGMSIVVRAMMKPIATTLKSQESLDLSTGEKTSTNYERSDFCPVPRAVPIIEAMVAFVLADALMEKLGGDSLRELKEHFSRLPEMNLRDFHLDTGPHIYWPMEE